jgi:transposase InsO family protein
MTDPSDTPMRVRWARLRLMIIGPLLAAPPESGELKNAIAELAARSWRHPTTGEAMRFSAKTIERWLYSARSDADPMRALERKVPKHAGSHPSVGPAVAEKIHLLRRQHPSWSFKLLRDNLVVLAREDPSLGVVPGYATVCRFMKHHGLWTFRRKRHEQEPGFVPRERRSFEVTHVHGLWHFDFHDGRRNVLTASGQWRKPYLLGILDDRSRLCCHAQWYLDVEAHSLAHGLSQAFQKRGLPRASLSDNGSAMLAAEITQGLERLGIIQHLTLPYSPEQNAKQEIFWAQAEGRLMPMLEGERELTLGLLNTATQAWVEQEYNRKLHSETGQTPLDRWLDGPSVGRPCPDSDTLRSAFRMQVVRTQRRSDGTVTCSGVRYEIPSRYRTLVSVTLRVARWDLSSVELVDRRSGVVLCTLMPLDKQNNADRQRRALTRPGPPTASSTGPLAHEPDASSGIAPLLRSLMADYAATGVPPAYLPKDDSLGEPAESEDET